MTLRRTVLAAAALYAAAGTWGLVKERRGALRCECTDDCWCKKPGLALFRWTFPLGHST